MILEYLLHDGQAASIQNRFSSAAVVMMACSVFWLAASCSPKEPVAAERSSAAPAPPGAPASVQPASAPSQAHSRPDPLAAFGDLAKHAESNDAVYVRSHLADSLLAKAKPPEVDPSSDPFLKGLMAQLKICQPTSWRAGAESTKIIVETKSNALGRELQFLFDFAYDEQRGWLLASHGYGRKPTGEAESAPINAPGGRPSD